MKNSRLVRTVLIALNYSAGRAIWADVAGNIRSMSMVAVTVLEGRVRSRVKFNMKNREDGG